MRAGRVVGEQGAALGDQGARGDQGQQIRPGKPKNQMSFPPLGHKWTVKSEVDWPGAEYTRRTRLKTRCEGGTTPLLDEVKALLGETNFNHYQEAMRPSINRRINAASRRPRLGGATPIHPSATLRRRGGDLTQTMSSTTFGMSGQQSRTRLIESTKPSGATCPATCGQPACRARRFARRVVPDVWEAHALLAQPGAQEHVHGVRAAEQGPGGKPSQQRMKKG